MLISTAIFHLQVTWESLASCFLRVFPHLAFQLRNASKNQNLMFILQSNKLHGRLVASQKSAVRFVQEARDLYGFD